MSSNEQLPDIDPSMYEQMAHTSLLLNVRSAIASADRRNRAILESQIEDQRPTSRRFVMLEVPDPSKSPRTLAFTQRNHRVLMTPSEQPKRGSISQLLIRTPVEEKYAVHGDHFLELIARSRRRYLLKEGGVWLYRSAADLVFDPSTGFTTRREEFAQSLESIRELSQVLGTHEPEQQTSSDIEF